MVKLRKHNIFNVSLAAIKMAVFWILIIFQIPIIFLLPKGKLSVGYMSFFMRLLMLVTGVRIKVHGKLSKKRPLLVVSNHISVFELAAFSIAFGGSFFGKKEVEKFPIVGQIAKKFGVIFLDRRPTHALEALGDFKKELAKVNYPMSIFPEGTTTNGSYVKPFKSTLFSFIENSDITVQPVVMVYKYQNGENIDDLTLAEHFAYFDNKKQDMGPMCSRERSAFGQVFHVMMLGGFKIEMTVLPPPQCAGMTRKEIAAMLQKIVSDKYKEFRK
ncbi:MAG TPA: 1-acyl-sn-glycerol-3-phosphate acyltransferase [Alphaproteobacteria bacterium]|nr:1-acyl-sn-glycerol-3-phosphate acyltransferase [Alphaproteobacteria bacterium]